MLPVKSRLLPSVTRLIDDDWKNLFDWSNVSFVPEKFSTPSVNIQEMDDKFLIELAVPGMKKEDFEIELSDNTLTIKSESKKEEEISEENFHRKEFSYQSFERSFNFAPDLVDESMIVAKYENGILMLSIPKKEEAKKVPAKKIQVS